MAPPSSTLPQTSQEPALVVRNLHKSFSSEAGATVNVLGDINLSVRAGEFVTVIGRTGCGKTTLLNIIAGLETPDSGSVELAKTLRPGRNIACVFQHYTLFPWRTAAANVAFAPQMRSVPRRQRKAAAAELLDRVGLAGFEKAYPHELSGGMRQRVAIAQALAMKPSLLLMDEPFGALDDSTRSDLQAMLTSLWQENPLTILFVTHNIDEAILLGDRLLVFTERPGQIVADFPVHLPRPRQTGSADFTKLFLKVRQHLR